MVSGARGVAAGSDLGDPGGSLKRVAAAALFATFFLSCDPVIRRVVVLTFNEAADLVTISASTILGTAKEGSPEARQIADQREALLSGRDEWSERSASRWSAICREI